MEKKVKSHHFCDGNLGLGVKSMDLSVGGWFVQSYIQLLIHTNILPTQSILMEHELARKGLRDHPLGEEGCKSAVL